MSKRKLKREKEKGVDPGIVITNNGGEVCNSPGVPLFIYTVTLSAVCIIVGLRWDISWHGSIGRDTFWSPPHVLVYTGALLAGLYSAIKVLKDSMKPSAEVKAISVRVWSVFYSPLGALFCIWGALAMLTSAPFDNWWHDAYGLDVVIVSPPHTLLGTGMLAIQLGACISISKYLNGKQKDQGFDTTFSKEEMSILRRLYIISAASLLSMVSLWVMDYTDKRFQRSGSFYIIVAIVILLFLPALGRQLRMKFGMTLITSAYFFLTAMTNWIMQLVPATPKLGPILTSVTHLQALPFPFLLFVPALVMDWFMQKIQQNDVMLAICISIAFTLLLLLVQYPLSGFLLESPAARNWFFGSDAWAYSSPPDWEYRYRFQPGEESSGQALLQGLVCSIIIGFFITWASLKWGIWMQRIRR